LNFDPTETNFVMQQRTKFMSYKSDCDASMVYTQELPWKIGMQKTVKTYLSNHLLVFNHRGIISLFVPFTEKIFIILIIKKLRYVNFIFEFHYKFCKFCNLLLKVGYFTWIKY
jgi:hypothetical protein